MKKLFFTLSISILLLSGLWALQKHPSFKVLATQDIGLNAEVALVNPKGPSYYVWLRFKSLPNFGSIKVFQDGKEAEAIPPQEYTDKNTGQKMMLSGVTYPSSGTHQYKVVIYDSSGSVLGEGVNQVTVPVGSYEPPATTPSFPKFPPLKITDWTKGIFVKLGKGNPIIGLLANIIKWFVWIASALAVIAFIYSGIMYITSSGNPERAEKAKKNMIWAVVAIIIIIMYLTIPGWIYSILTKEAPK